MKTYISSRMPVLSQGSFLVRDHTFCVCMWESHWMLFTLEESEIQGLPILKLTGPFRSNHQMCHGKNRYVMAQGTSRLCQHQYFPSSVAMNVVLTMLTYLFSSLSTSLQVVLQQEDEWHTPTVHDPRCNVINNRQKKRNLCHLPQIGSSGN